MKNVLLIILSIFFLTACDKAGEKESSNQGAIAQTQTEDLNTVYVYYFHGKKRCNTCNTVEKVAREVIESTYTSNSKVQFVVIPTYEKSNEALVEKHQISWNGLIVTKGSNSTNITQEAFANAVKNPLLLAESLKREIDKRL